VPFLDRGASSRGRSPVFTGIGVVVAAYIVGMTAWGYRSWVPVYAVLVTGAGVAIFAWLIRHRENESGP
jgi:quinol-cytochrome oxidoreductase complex cytochrome b subunit